MIGVHRGSRMRDAHINEMSDAGALGRADGLDPRALIDLYKFPGFRGTWVRHTHQLDECVASRKMLLVRRAVECIAQYRPPGNR